MMARIPQILALCTVVVGCGPPMMLPSQSTPQRVQMKQAARPQAPILKRLANGHYRVRKPWAVALNGRIWMVQKGYTSNGMTAPQRIKNALGDGIDKPETWAAVFHDWLFTQPGMTRAEADRTFHELLLAYGVSPAKAEMMYTTVKAYSLTKGFR